MVFKPDEVVAGSNKKAEWVCSVDTDHKWSAVIAARAKNGHGCPYCAGQRAVRGQNDLATTHAYLRAEWADSREMFTVSAGSGYEAVWQCRQHGHKYSMRVHYKVSEAVGCCPYCNGWKVLAGFDDLATTHPHLAAEWADERDITTVTHGSDYVAKWRCSEHGHEYTAKVSKRAGRGAGCTVCSGFKVLAGYNDLATTHPHLAAEWADERDITTVSAGNHYRAWWQCEQRGHLWQTAVYNRAGNFSSCPSCSYLGNRSRSEKEIVAYIESLGFSADSDRSVLSGRELDIYIPEKRFAIEYNGLYWHSEAAGKDKWYHYRKWSECEQQGIQLLTIWEDDYARNPELIRRMVADGLGMSTESSEVSSDDTEFSLLSETEATAFLDRHHLSGFQKSARYYCLRDVNNADVLAMIGTSCSADGTELLVDCFAVSAGVSLRSSQVHFNRLLGGILAESEHGHVLSVTAWSQNDYDDPEIFVSNGFKEVAQEEPTCSVIVAGERQFCPDEEQLVLLEGKNRVWDCGRTQWRKFVS